MLIKLLLFSLIILMVINIIIAIDEECSKLSAFCNEASNCRECIRKHHCCVWCYDQEFKGSRCNILSVTQNSTCRSEFIENNVKTGSTITKNVSFTDVETDTTKAVQMSPGEFNINLRYGEPINITIGYRPAKNYPLDLYYLMDLTKSMQPDLDTLKNLGTKLADELKTLTTNHRIAFGSYIDKPETPFYNAAPINKENPCTEAHEICEMGYVFKHRLNFTDDIKMFTSEVGKSGVSANLDNLEGGVDALMQIMLCGNRLGWADNSRKLALVATEGLMHFAGDGLLAGYIQRNKDLCLVDSNGNYTSLIHYDYPSLEEIHRQLKNKKINLIIAAKESVISYYEEMKRVLKENVFVGKLDEDSTNVLKLVKDGYYEFMHRVNLFVNTSEINDLEVKFFADCNKNGRWEQKGHCDNAEEGKEMEFKVQLQLNDYRTGNTRLYIEESNIYEKIPVNINFVGTNCNCHMLPSTTEKCSTHGEFNCGDCICNDGWSGQTCSEECKNTINECRLIEENFVSLTCSGRGDCICSKCHCELPYIQGKFCEFVCPYNQKTREICGGHGTCINDTCECHPEYINDDCSCHNSTTDCKIADSSECSGHGICKCNKCICDYGFSGKYCEYCNECATQSLCTKYEQHVYEHVEKHLQNNYNDTIKVETVEDLPEKERSCVMRYKTEDGKTCDIFYKYKVNSNVVDIKATKPICVSPAKAGFLALYIVAAILIAGLLMIGLVKLRNVYRDKREYEQFLREQESSLHSEQNPLYRNPVVTYQNPVGTVQIHSKSD